MFYQSTLDIMRVPSNVTFVIDPVYRLEYLEKRGDCMAFREDPTGFISCN